MLAAIFSALHLLALGLGLGAVWSRGWALRALARDPQAIGRVLAADSAWGIAALLWIGSGLARVLGGLDKDTSFYVHNGFFWVKMAVFGLVFGFEMRPMITFVRWRMARARGAPPDTGRAAVLVRINDAETVLVVVLVFIAAMMARGLWLLV